MTSRKRGDSPDAPYLIKSALERLPAAGRRRFLRQTLTLGGLAMLTGCSVDEDGAESVLMNVSRFNDRVQGWLFDANRLAPTCTTTT